MADPLSAAGLGLGAGSLAIQLWDGVKQGCAYFESAVNMPSECQSIQTGLMMEYERLRIWGEMAKLNAENGYDGFDRSVKTHFSVIMAVLSEINTVLRDMRKRALHFPETALPDQYHLEEPAENQSEGSWKEKYDEIISSPNDATEQEKHSRFVRRALRMIHGIREVSTDPRRIRWAVGTDKPKLEAGLKKLRKLTTYLYDTAEDEKLDIILQSTYEIRLALLQLLPPGITIDSPREDATSASSASLLSDSSTIVGGESRTGVVTSSRHRQALFERLAAFSTRFAHTNDDAWDDIEQPLLLELDALSMVDKGADAWKPESLADRAITSLDNERVWVEWRPYDPVTVPDPGKSGSFHVTAQPEVEKCVRRLARLLHDDAKPLEFKVPHCRGFVQDKTQSRFGFVYDLPNSSKTGLKSLYEEISSGDSPTPPLDSRFATARKLVATVFCLHAVKWLHKRLSSVNVLLFTHGGSPDLTEPYISGFESSRPDEGVTMTMPSKDPDWTLMYCHPDYVEERRRVFGKTFDLYSLGIVLLEIAYWKPVFEIFQIDKKLAVNRATVDRIRDSLIDEGSEQLAYVQAAMGKRYCDALRTCVGGLDGFSIKSDADEADPVIGAMVQQAYLRLVVDTLNNITL